MTDDILDLIDAAVRDHEIGPDAMRCNGPFSSVPSWSENAGPSGLILVGPAVFGPEVPALDLELVLRPIVDHFATMAEGFRLLSQRMGEITIFTAGFTAQLARAFGIELPHGAPGAPPCACHSKPFPAAWDYRRRTRHRSRRRR